jgi:capsular polysaccharide biosynthesis protein
MPANIPNPKISHETDLQENALEKNQQMQYLLFRLFPFWPWIALALIMGYTTAYILLRYSTPVYQVKTRIIINDNSQEKSANLQEIIKLDTRNLSSETEKEIETIRSLDLLKKVVSKLQLNVVYSGKGNIKSSQLNKNLPVTLELANPDSVKTALSGEVKIIGKQISYNGELFPVDSFVNTSIGNISWHINKNVQPGSTNSKFIVAVTPVASMARQLKGAISVTPMSKQSSILDIASVDVFTERAALILNTLIEMYGTT